MSSFQEVETLVIQVMSSIDKMCSQSSRSLNKILTDCVVRSSAKKYMRLSRPAEVGSCPYTREAGGRSCHWTRPTKRSPLRFMTLIATKVVENCKRVRAPLPFLVKQQAPKGRTSRQLLWMLLLDDINLNCIYYSMTV
jgi:hypothetical protein